jgi:hypothetical protein
MNFSEFKLFYWFTFSAIAVLSVMAIGLCIQDSWIFWLSRQEFANLIKQLNATNLEAFIMKTALPWLMIFLVYVLKFTILQVMWFGFKKLPVPSKWILNWDSANEFPHLLGRMIVFHLRGNTYLSYGNLMFMNKLCNKELLYLSRHRRNEKLVQLFKKYDRSYMNDEKNI